jgi:hypothetical protein
VHLLKIILIAVCFFIGFSRQYCLPLTLLQSAGHLQAWLHDIAALYHRHLVIVLGQLLCIYRISLFSLWKQDYLNLGLFGGKNPFFVWSPAWKHCLT